MTTLADVADVDVAVGLYQRLLGRAAEDLAPVVRAVHVGSGLGHGTGSLQVRREHRLAVLASPWLGLPPDGAVVPLQLAVVRTPGREVWVRLFGAQSLVTEQYAGGDGALVERSGRGELHFRLDVEHGALRFRPLGAAVLVAGRRVRLPRRLAPNVRGTATASPDGRRLVVHFTIGVPVLGTILTYHVELEPSS